MEFLNEKEKKVLGAFSSYIPTLNKIAICFTATLAGAVFISFGVVNPLVGGYFFAMGGLALSGNCVAAADIFAVNNFCKEYNITKKQFKQLFKKLDKDKPRNLYSLNKRLNRINQQIEKNCTQELLEKRDILQQRYNDALLKKDKWFAKFYNELNIMKGQGSSEGHVEKVSVVETKVEEKTDSQSLINNTAEYNKSQTEPNFNTSFESGRDNGQGM